MSEMVRLSLVGLFCWSTALCTLAQPATAPQQLYTEHEYRQEALGFYRRIILDSYNEVGQRDPRWDASVQYFLDGVCRHLAFAGAELLYKSPDVLPRKDLVALGQACIDKGCKDPLVPALVGVLLAQAWETDRAREHLELAERRLRKSSYPLPLAFLVCSHLVDVTRDEAQDRHDQQAWDLLRATLCYWQFQDIDRRVIFGWIEEYLGTYYDARQRAFFEAARSLPDADPWMVAMIGGRYHTHAAWNADYGTDTSHRHALKARRLFERAWHLRPKLPEAPAECVYATGLAEGDDEQVWFDRAVAIQHDFRPAYRNYLWALNPRIDGSERQMYEFGLQCARSQRFDTRVPFFLIETIIAINDEAESGEFWREPGVYESARPLLERRPVEPRLAEHADWYRFQHIGAAWNARRYDELKKLLAQVGDEPDYGGLSSVWAESDDWGKMHAFVSPYGPQVQKAEAEVEANNAAAALAIYRQLKSATPIANPARDFLHNRTADLARLVSFQSGDWTPLLDSDLAGWETLAGEWALDAQGRLVGTSSEYGLQILCDTDFGRYYELRGVVEFLENPDDEEPNGGPIVAYHDDREHYRLWLGQKQQQAVLRCGYGHWNPQKAKVTRTNHFRIVRRDQKLTITINGKPAFQGWEMRHDVPQLASRVGLAADYEAEGAVVRFSKLRIRKLAPPPTTAPATQASRAE